MILVPMLSFFRTHFAFCPCLPVPREVLPILAVRVCAAAKGVVSGLLVRNRVYKLPSLVRLVWEWVWILQVQSGTG